MKLQLILQRSCESRLVGYVSRQLATSCSLFWAYHVNVSSSAGSLSAVGLVWTAIAVLCRNHLPLTQALCLLIGSCLVECLSLMLSILPHLISIFFITLALSQVLLSCSIISVRFIFFRHFPCRFSRVNWLYLAFWRASKRIQSHVYFTEFIFSIALYYI
jgi:hypothetical protein